MELTKEYFDSQLDRLNNRMDGFASKDDLKKQTEQLNGYNDKQTEKLARMFANGFEDVRTRLDVTDRLNKVDQKFAKLEELLRIQP